MADTKTSDARRESTWRDIIRRLATANPLAQEFVRQTIDLPRSRKETDRLQRVLLTILSDPSAGESASRNIESKLLQEFSDPNRSSLQSIFESMQAAVGAVDPLERQELFNFHLKYNQRPEPTGDAMLRLVLRKPADMSLAEVSQTLASLQIFVWFLYVCESISLAGNAPGAMEERASQIMVQGIDNFPLKMRTTHYGSPYEVILVLLTSGSALVTIGLRAIKLRKRYSDLAVELHENQVKKQQLDLSSQKIQLESDQLELKSLALKAVRNELVSAAGPIYASIVTRVAEQQLDAVALVLTETLEIEPIPPKE